MRSRQLGNLICAWVLLFPAITACAQSDPVWTLKGATMGTTYNVKIVATDDSPKANVIQAAIDARLDDINQKMSTYIDDSEVSRFNRAPSGQWFPVSQDTLHVVTLAQQLSDKTDGAFDITVGPLVRLWNFGAGADQRPFEPPSRDAIQTTMQTVGYQKLQTQSDPPALRKQVDGLEIDLSAVAKGYAVDQVFQVVASMDRASSWWKLEEKFESLDVTRTERNGRSASKPRLGRSGSCIRLWNSRMSRWPPPEIIETTRCIAGQLTRTHWTRGPDNPSAMLWHRLPY